MTLGILAAMEEEISLVTEMIEAPVHTELGGRVFVQGKINGIVGRSKCCKIATHILHRVRRHALYELR